MKLRQRTAGWNITATDAVSLLSSQSKLQKPFLMLHSVGIHIQPVRGGPAAAGAPDLDSYGDILYLRVDVMSTKAT